MHVEGWTDKPTVERSLVHVWQSFCDFAQWGEETPSAVIAWVSTKFWREDAEGRSVLVDVFLELLRERDALRPRPKE